jgi:hemerythrin
LRDTHQEKHRVLVARLLAAYKRFKQKREKLEAEGVACDHHSYAELLGILNAWLLEHILQEDMKLKPHIQRHLESRLAAG